MIDRVHAIPDKRPQFSPELFLLMRYITFPAMMNTDPTLSPPWIDRVRLYWPTFRTIVIQVLSSNPPANINLLPNNEADLNEMFTLPKREIRDNVVRMRGKDLKDIYRYFELGELVGKSNDGESILRITRKGILQLYIAAFARKYLLLKIEIPDIKGEYPIRNPFDGETSFEGTRRFAYWDRLVRGKPKRGGSLLNVK